MVHPPPNALALAGMWALAGRGPTPLHAVSFVPVTLLGLAFMAREGLSLGRMREMAAETKT